MPLVAFVPPDVIEQKEVLVTNKSRCAVLVAEAHNLRLLPVLHVQHMVVNGLIVIILLVFVHLDPPAIGGPTAERIEVIPIGLPFLQAMARRVKLIEGFV